jgi:hypothetical protein
VFAEVNNNPPTKFGINSVDGYSQSKAVLTTTSEHVRDIPSSSTNLPKSKRKISDIRHEQTQVTEDSFSISDDDQMSSGEENYVSESDDENGWEDDTTYVPTLTPHQGTLNV